MRSTSSIALLVGTLLLILLGPAAAAWPEPGAPAATTVDDALHASEAERIKAHLAKVEKELIERDVSHLSASQRNARARHIQVLRRYRVAGVFPHNHDFPDRRVPYFVDEHGTLCALAYLVAQSGRTDLVNRIAATRNNARVRDLADDTALVAWIDRAGLSLDEAARIQPQYGCCTIVDPTDEPVEPEFVLANAVIASLEGLSISLNATNSDAVPAGWRGALGIAAGAAGVALGVSDIDEDGVTRILGGFNVGAGLASAALGTRALIIGDGADDRTAARAARAPRRTQSNRHPAKKPPALADAPGKAAAASALRPMTFEAAPMLLVQNEAAAPGLRVKIRF